MITNECKAKLHLSELFHYDPALKKNSELKKALQEYQFLLAISSVAIHHLQERDFEKFDSLVGENACQIRAIRVAMIASYCEKINGFIQLNLTIKNKLKKIEELLTPSSINSLMHQRRSLKDVIDEHQLDILLSSDEMFIIQSFLLSEMKECQADGDILSSIFRIERCAPAKLQEKYPHISYTFMIKLAKRLRSLLSKKSVGFVRKIAADFQDPALMNMVAEDFEVQHNDLACIPAFWSFKALLAFAKQQMIPFILHVKFLNENESEYRVIDEEKLFFKVCHKSDTYVVIEPNEEDLLEPACVIQGVVCPNGESSPCKIKWRDSILKYSIIDLLLAIGAIHPQYPGQDREFLVQNQEFDFYKILAEEGGFSVSNPTTFFAQHIYCVQANKMMSVQPTSLSVS